MRRDQNNNHIVENVHIIGSSAAHDSILSVVASLPEDVCEWVAGNITFVDMSGVSGLATSVNTEFPSETRKREVSIHSERLLILINQEASEEHERVLFRIAHEIAHHWCGHGDTSTKEEYERQEREADTQANEWGYSGESYRVV